MSSDNGNNFEEVVLPSPASIVDIHFLFDGSLWVANAIGEVFKAFDGEVEELGVQEGGILASRWSPDGELLLIIGSDLEAEDSLQVLTADFDPIAVQPAVSTEPGEQIMVNVGWGSRSTQFMGQAGKESREIELKSATKLSEQDNLKVELCWRGDAELFCTSVPCFSGRRTRIYNREGNHLSTTDSPSTFLGPLSWRASSLLSAAAESIAGRPIIAQIERNGLEHGQIELILKDQLVNKISWNASGVLLLIQYANFYEIWRQGNYHWYRQVLQKISAQDYIFWDDFDANTLHVSSGERLNSLHVEQFVNVYQQSKVLVADGEFNNFTDYEAAIIPPPMFQNQIKSSESRPAVPTQDGVLSVTDKAILDSQESVVIEGDFVCVRQLYSLAPNTVVLIHDLENDCVIEYATPKMSVRKSVKSSFVTHLAPVNEESFFYATVNEAKEYALIKAVVSKEKETIEIEKVNFFSSMVKNLFCSQEKPVYLVKNIPYYGIEKLPLKSGETVLSLAANDDFIAATTTSHELLIWDISKATEIKSWYAVRRGCERGASIVTLFGTNVVLQMPRGNIETVEPRAMLLKQLESLLDAPKIDWLKMFKLCRRQRVNLNLLVDHSG